MIMKGELGPALDTGQGEHHLKVLLNMNGHGLPDQSSRPFSARIPPDLPW